MLEFLMSNIWNIVTIALFILFMLYLWFVLDKKKEINGMLLLLVVKAKEYFEDGTGAIKYQYVIDEFYKAFPSILKIFIKRKMLDMWIDEAYKKMKEIFEKNSLDTAYK